MDTRLDTRRIFIYLGLSFGIAWLIGLIVYLTGGMVDSPRIIPGAGITLALLLIASGYMFAPAIAHMLTRLITNEGWSGAGLAPRLRRGWPYWLAAWFVPALLTILGMAVYFLAFPRSFDSSLTTVRQMLAASGQVDLNPWAAVAAQVLQAVLIAPVINGLFTFGEEFGWRGYLQPKLAPLGGQQTMLLMGVIWGVWHWPVIAMGHNYGFGYPGAPWTGMLAMVWFTFVTGTFLGWATWRAGSVWPAVIGHAAINGIAGLGLNFLQGQPNLLIGPMPTGLLASLGWTVVAFWIFMSDRALRPAEGEPGPAPEVTEQTG